MDDNIVLQQLLQITIQRIIFEVSFKHSKGWEVFKEGDKLF